MPASVAILSKMFYICHKQETKRSSSSSYTHSKLYSLMLLVLQGIFKTPLIHPNFWSQYFVTSWVRFVYLLTSCVFFFFFFFFQTYKIQWYLLPDSCVMEIAEILLLISYQVTVWETISIRGIFQYMWIMYFSFHYHRIHKRLQKHTHT